MDRHVVLIAVAAVGSSGCGRLGFEPRTDAQASPPPGMGGFRGISLSAPGALFFGKDIGLARTPKDEFAVAWAEFPPGSAQLELMFAVVSPNGGLVVPPRSIRSLGGELHEAEIAASVDGYTIVFSAGSDFDDEVIRLDTAGDITAEIAGARNYNERALAVSDQVAIAYQFTRMSRPAVGVRILGLDGVEIADLAPVTASNNDQVRPSIAAVDSGFAVAWRESSRIQLALLDGTGGVTQPGTVIDNNGASQDSPRIARGGITIATAWSENSNGVARAQRTGPGRWTPAPVIAPLPLRESPTLEIGASDVGDLGVAYESDAVLYTQIVLARGASSTEPWSVVAATDPDYHTCCPQVAAGRDGYAVAFCAVADGTVAAYLGFGGDP